MEMREKYFTIHLYDTGLTDQLHSFSALYKLGLSLSYKYLHVPFSSQRTSSFFLKSNFPDIESINESTDVYDFIGFNDYFIKKNKNIKLKDPCVIEIFFHEHILTENNIKSINDLQNYIIQHIPDKSIFTRELLFRFKLIKTEIYPAKFLRLIHSGITEFQDNLDIKKIYFNYRLEHPWHSIYPEVGIKTLVHIRQGDTAVLETPWNNILCLWPKEIRFNEYRNIKCIKDGRILRINDFYLLLKSLDLYFEDKIFSYLIFSDGFTRARKYITENSQDLDYTQGKLENLLNHIDTFDKEKFKNLKYINNSKLVIGETPENLFNFFHSIFTAELIITGTHQRLILKLIATCFNHENMPVIIILGRYLQPKNIFNILVSNKLNDKIIYVDMNKPDFTSVSKRLSHLLNINTVKPVLLNYIINKFYRYIYS